MTIFPMQDKKIPKFLFFQILRHNKRTTARVVPTFLLLFLGDEVQGDGAELGAQLGVLDTGGIHHPLGGQGGHGIGVLVGEVQDLPDAGLDDGLGK